MSTLNYQRTVLDEVSKVYSDLTGGLINNPDTKAEDVLTAITDCQNETWEEVLRDEKEKWKEEFMNSVVVKVKKLRPNAIVPQYQTTGAVGVDLHAVGCDNEHSLIVNGKPAIRLYPGDYKVIFCGIAIELPDGWEAQVRPRSGLAAKYGISVVNSPGTVDADYRGEIGVTLINHGDKALDIFDGDRIAQMVCKPVPQVTFEVVDSLSATVRGSGGMGSTGGSKAL